jgi:cytochrome c oxidase assembly factor CtaG
MNMVVSHWSANAAVLAVVAAVGAVHLRGLRGVAADAGRGGDMPRGLGREVAAFYGGLFVVVLALLSPLAYWSAHYIWVRSVQDVLLANLAPAFLVLGAPWLVLRRGLPFRLARAHEPGRDPAAGHGAGPGHDTDPGRAARLARMSVITVIAFNVAWCCWHLPALYDGALRYPAVYAAEVVTYLGLGVAFWLQLIGSRPLGPALVPLRRAALLAGTVIVSTVLGMVLVFGYGLAYPGYAGPGHRVLSVVYDQQAGGAVLWVLVLPAYVTAGVALLIKWLNDEEAQALASGLDRLLKPAKPAWPSRPGLRRS